MTQLGPLSDSRCCAVTSGDIPLMDVVFNKRVFIQILHTHTHTKKICFPPFKNLYAIACTSHTSRKSCCLRPCYLQCMLAPCIFRGTHTENGRRGTWESPIVQSPLYKPAMFDGSFFPCLVRFKLSTGNAWRIYRKPWAVPGTRDSAPTLLLPRYTSAPKVALTRTLFPGPSPHSQICGIFAKITCAGHV